METFQPNGGHHRVTGDEGFREVEHDVDGGADDYEHGRVAAIQFEFSDDQAAEQGSHGKPEDSKGR